MPPLSSWTPPAFLSRTGPPSGFRWAVLVSLLLWGGPFHPQGAAKAQQVELRLLPSGGIFFPTSVLYRSDLPPATAELTAAPVVGIGVHAQMDDFPVSLRATLERLDWFNTKVTGRTPRPGIPEEDYQVHTFAVPTAITLFTGDLLVHPYVEWDRLAPYLFVGFGWKSYAFGQEEPEDDAGFKFPDDGTSARIHYGAGLELRLGGRVLAGDIGGNFNRFVLVDEETGRTRPHPQHEVVLSVRVPLRMLTF